MNTKMKSSYKFLRVHQGLPRFAKITAASEPADDWCIFLEPEIDELWIDAVESGLRAAMAEQERLGARRFSITASSLVWSPVDTTEDAVRCAATVAAWMSFGNDAALVCVRMDGPFWTVSFDPAV